MSDVTELADAIGAPVGRYNPVSAAYDGMSEVDREAFREIIQDDRYTHAQVAGGMRAIGYNVDRKQIQQFREKLALGKVIL